MTLVHLGCNARAEHTGSTEPPDPDRHGNLRFQFRCPACGERTTLLHVPYRGPIPEAGWKLESDIEWAVPLR
jgi:hypothetical protein